MPRRPGQLVRCRCNECGAIEMRTGCTNEFRCIACDPTRDEPSLQRLAHKAVAAAIAAGSLQSARSFACADCGRPATEYDHRDYHKPLEVEPVCRRCNLRRGPAIGSTAKRATAAKAA